MSVHWCTRAKAGVLTMLTHIFGHRRKKYTLSAMGKQSTVAGIQCMKRIISRCHFKKHVNDDIGTWFIGNCATTAGNAEICLASHSFTMNIDDGTALRLITATSPPTFNACNGSHFVETQFEVPAEWHADEPEDVIDNFCEYDIDEDAITSQENHVSDYTISEALDKVQFVAPSITPQQGPAKLHSAPPLQDVRAFERTSGGPKARVASFREL